MIGLLSDSSCWTDLRLTHQVDPHVPGLISFPTSTPDLFARGAVPPLHRTQYVTRLQPATGCQEIETDPALNIPERYPVGFTSTRTLAPAGTSAIHRVPP
jgi:hypothetical protein